MADKLKDLMRYLILASFLVVPSLASAECHIQNADNPPFMMTGREGDTFSWRVSLSPDCAPDIGLSKPLFLPWCNQPSFNMKCRVTDFKVNSSGSTRSMRVEIERRDGKWSQMLGTAINQTTASIAWVARDTGGIGRAIKDTEVTQHVTMFELPFLKFAISYWIFTHPAFSPWWTTWWGFGF